MPHRRLFVIAIPLIASVFWLGRTSAPKPIPQPTTWRVRVATPAAGMVPAEIVTLFDRKGCLAGPTDGGLEFPVTPGDPIRIEVVRLDGEAVNILLGDW